MQWKVICLHMHCVLNSPCAVLLLKLMFAAALIAKSAAAWLWLALG